MPFDFEMNSISPIESGGGVTPSGTISITENGTYNVTSYASADVSVAGSSGKYQLLERVKDDNNNEIGTVVGFFTGSHTGAAPYTEYAVVCLDAKYRQDTTKITKTTDTVPNLPIYNNLTTASPWRAKDTATFNTQKFIDSGQTTDACTFCRSKSFVIEGVTYYGQLMNVVELVDLCKIGSGINELDTSLPEYETLAFWNQDIYSSTAGTLAQVFCASSLYASIRGSNRSVSSKIFPILEIPNQ